MTEVSYAPSTSTAELSISPNDPQYPQGYFDVQVEFAKRWSEIAGEDIAETLLHKTALYRAITAEKPTEDTSPLVWAAFLNGRSPAEVANISERLYDVYAQQPHSRYVPPQNRFGMFGYEIYQDRNAVKLHIDNPRRGISPLAPEHLRERHTEFKAMLEEIQHTHSEITTFLTGSWVYSTEKFRNLLPPNVETKDLMSLDMFFGGNSLWGQFINKDGELNERLAHEFLKGIRKADSLQDLIDAFPRRTIFTQGAIERYYEHYGVEMERPTTEDFTLPFFERLVNAVREEYGLYTFSEAGELFDGMASAPRVGLIRHDIDSNPQRAAILARIEKGLGVRATYFVAPNLPAYDISDSTVIADLQTTADLGHEVGLHYNASNKLRETGNLADLEESIAADAKRLERAVGIPIGAVSFHCPAAQQKWLNGPLRLGAFVNAYAAVLMSPDSGALYATDSTGAWRYGNPIERLERARADASTKVVQILTHAEWWPTASGDNIKWPDQL